ncbi:hypothetical protein L0Z31_09385 [Burkholderia vietnamiensis]|uniref:hypothetical protein n=1 Tax=Burkholderia vietnamiensis TaxID=60552 RepID=UPI0007545F41|nr:hypothetical protein [Burkholderia vietnamiensis]KVS12767.1 hypothetical protein WK32_32785 [Burkholderia vietnamiensis]MCO1351634.1 hypothetical protein [Burkholderia vietnamiensis]MCO1430174.1 hypothetical protein [Burkholderia vietnamiensis]UQN50991.1 hypothetical protein L0Y95_29230 [Burkholderia vietnamiensis]HDR9036962.1 hypothetical protein [Burkholderia vietnamiensis]
MSLIGVLAGAGIILLAQEFLPGYFRKKGENLATKEDIAEITRRQEEIKHQFAEIIEVSKQRHSLRTLVADKRMDAHQQAFKKVKGLLSARDNQSVIDDCKAWMDDYCLYLALGARQAVWQAIGHAEVRAHCIAEATNEGNGHEQRRAYHESAVNEWTAIMAALPEIVTAVELPALGDEELAAIRASAAPAQI